MNYTGRGFRFNEPSKPSAKPPVKRSSLSVVKALLVATFAGLLGAGGLTAIVLPLLMVIAIFYGTYTYVLCDLVPGLPPVNYFQVLALVVAVRAAKWVVS
ncbi:MAG: hypothetical protein AMXMBFR16_11530 [Candidatus Uhrbacteria bacterium]